MQNRYTNIEFSVQNLIGLNTKKAITKIVMALRVSLLLRVRFIFDVLQ
jgi:hypothetical protein